MITFGWKAGRIASKLGLTPYRRLRLGIKYEIAKKKFGNKVFDIKKHITKYPKKYTAAAVGIPVVSYIATGGPRKDQNIKIEMQKISKEKWAGKKFTRKEISSRLKKAKQSKREFTWF
jgi:hypothetical protein